MRSLTLAFETLSSGGSLVGLLRGEAVGDGVCLDGGRGGIQIIPSPRGFWRGGGHGGEAQWVPARGGAQRGEWPARVEWAAEEET